MLIAPHAAAGMAIGAVVGNPWLAAPLAVASHFALDSVPHWQETLAPYTPTKKTWIRVPVDIMLALALTVVATHWQPDHAAAIWTGAIFANLPDLDGIVILLPGLKHGALKTFWDWHCKIQRETSSLWGLIPQIIVVLTSLFLVRKS